MPKPDVNRFFAAQQGAAVLKLAILKRYLYPFAMKIGSTAPGRRVVYLDPYAGKGEYDDGSAGSPLLAARTSHQIAENRILECLYAEEKRPVARRLSEVLATVEHPHRVWPRRFEDCLDEMLERTGLAPMFAFLDPFGLTIPFDALAGKVLKRSGKTEVLINVSLNGLWHHAGQLNNTSEGGEETRKRSIARLDGAMGGDWWQEVWARHSHAQRRERDEALVTEYVRRLATAGGGGWSWWAVDVPDRWEGPPAYYLAFMTRSMDGVWLFTDALSGAMDEFEIWCHERQEREEAAKAGDQLRFAFDWQAARAERDDRWAERIAANIAELLKTGSVNVQSSIDKIYGSQLIGRAREKHLRRAWDLLAERGAAKDRPTNQKIARSTITPA